MKWQETEIGSLLTAVDELMAKGEFTDAGIEIRAGEEVIGKMNQFECALLTLQNQKADAWKKISESRTKEAQDDQDRIKAEVGWLITTLYRQIDFRLGTFTKNTAVRNGFQIVKIPEEIDLIPINISGIKSGIMIICGKKII